jgi:hypothetical protein
MKMEVLDTSEIFVNAFEATLCRNPEDHDINLERRENLKSYA